ncbi:hypothetical protein [Cryobacterium levicorallinum]|nr:hypothetical protein [Cryobacterium levicorallinum]
MSTAPLSPDLDSDLDLDDFEPDDVEVELVVFDMAGTTVSDNGLVERAFVLAAQRNAAASPTPPTRWKRPSPTCVKPWASPSWMSFAN